ncbi:MAG TPA: 3D domain-containing protein [Tepidisphaeraceae bacterium]|nr:3D domain-containing protein [Tepidisphaeraceae bacterium]
MLRITGVVVALLLALNLAVVVMGSPAEPISTSKNFVPQSPLSVQAQAELMHETAVVAVKPAAVIVPHTRTITMMVTAYCPCEKCCGPNAAGITANGSSVTYNEGRFVAADSSIPFGTKLIIPGYDAGPVEVIDRGGAIKGNHIDVFFPTHEEALRWGRRMVQVTILD